MDKKMQEWKSGIEFTMSQTGGSAHDALCDLMEQSREPLSDDECRALMTLMGEYWG